MIGRITQEFITLKEWLLSLSLKKKKGSQITLTKATLQCRQTHTYKSQEKTPQKNSKIFRLLQCKSTPTTLPSSGFFSVKTRKIIFSAITHEEPHIQFFYFFSVTIAVWAQIFLTLSSLNGIYSIVTKLSTPTRSCERYKIT